MRQRFGFLSRTWAANLALALVMSLLGALAVAASASAQAPQAMSPTAQALATASGQPAQVQVQFQIQPTTQAYTGVWVNIYSGTSASPGTSLTGGAQKVLGAVYNNVYTVVYNAYQTVAGVFGTAPTVIGSAYQNATDILYNVYLNIQTQPPNGVGSCCVNTGGTTPAQQPSSTITSSSGVVLGGIQTASKMVDGLFLPVVQLQVTDTGITQALSNLSSTTQTLVITIPSADVPVGGVVEAQLPPAALQAVETAGKSLQLVTPQGGVVLSPRVLRQILAQGGSATTTVRVRIHATPQSLLTQIQQSIPSTQSGELQSAGTPVDIAVQFVNSSGTASGIFEPANGATLGLSLPYQTANFSGEQALLLGIYRYSLSQKAWVYAGGVTDLTSGTVTVPAGHLSTYAVFADNHTFSDIQGFWAQTDIQLMVAHHVVNGMTSTVFAPNGAVTRAQFAAMITRALSLSTPAVTLSFSDVPSSAWYAGVVAAAVKAGIVKGFPNGTFQPNAPITRQQMAVMVARAMRAAGRPATVLPQQVALTLATYTDHGKVASWAQSDMAIAVEQHIINGMTPTTLSPAAATTRAQAAVMVKRLLGYLGDL